MPSIASRIIDSLAAFPRNAARVTTLARDRRADWRCCQNRSRWAAAPLAEPSAAGHGLSARCRVLFVWDAGKRDSRTSHNDQRTAAAALLAALGGIGGEQGRRERRRILTN